MWCGGEFDTTRRVSHPSPFLILVIFTQQKSIGLPTCSVEEIHKLLRIHPHQHLKWRCRIAFLLFYFGTHHQDVGVIPGYLDGHGHNPRKEQHRAVSLLTYNLVILCCLITQDSSLSLRVVLAIPSRLGTIPSPRTEVRARNPQGGSESLLYPSSMEDFPWSGHLLVRTTVISLR